MIDLTSRAEGTIIPVRAQPGARKNAILGPHDGALRVAVSAAPERGKANEAIQKVLAEALGCKVSQVTLVQGRTARAKKFLVRGVAIEQLARRIQQLVLELTTENTERKTEEDED